MFARPNQNASSRGIPPARAGERNTRGKPIIWQRVLFAMANNTARAAEADSILGTTGEVPEKLVSGWPGEQPGCCDDVVNPQMDQRFPPEAGFLKPSLPAFGWVRLGGEKLLWKPIGRSNFGCIFAGRPLG